MFPVNILGEPPAPCCDVAINDGESWCVPEESPIAFVYNRRNYAVMMASPIDLVDFAIGFSITEKIISSIDDIQSLEIRYTNDGVELRVALQAAALERLDLRQQRRTTIGNVGCGLCGLENAYELTAPLQPVAAYPIDLDLTIVKQALNNLRAHQVLNNRTRSVHAAGWVSENGEVILVREDVGRHNAFDKLLGAMEAAAFDMDVGFVVLSSRCSFELVQKAASRGVRALASISAPTLLALKKAKEANIAIFARAGEGVVTFACSKSLR